MFIGELSGEKPALLLGLSDVNVMRLTQGQPIRLTAETHPHAGTILKGLDILIIYGKTELDIMDYLKQAGLIVATTKAHIDPRLLQG